MIGYYYILTAQDDEGKTKVGDLYLLQKESEFTFYMRRTRKTQAGNWTGFWIHKRLLNQFFKDYNP